MTKGVRLRLRDGDISRIVAALKPETAAEPDNWLETAVHRSLVVHTMMGESYEGVLRHSHDDGLLLWGGQTMVRDQTGKQTKVTLSGDIFIPREQVAFIQTTRS